MKNVTEYAPYVAAVELLQRLMEKCDQLKAERKSILDELRFDSSSPVRALGRIDYAKAVLDGVNVPLNRAVEFSALRDRELEVRKQVEVLEVALRAQSEAIEMERRRARDAAIASREKEVAAVRMRMNEACRKLMAALAAEDEFLIDLATGGFGRQEPGITSPYWLNREMFMSLEREQQSA